MAYTTAMGGQCLLRLSSQELVKKHVPYMYLNATKLYRESFHEVATPTKESRRTLVLTKVGC